jgi:hypothetical protein
MSGACAYAVSTRSCAACRERVMELSGLSSPGACAAAHRSFQRLLLCVLIVRVAGEKRALDTLYDYAAYVGCSFGLCKMSVEVDQKPMTPRCTNLAAVQMGNSLELIAYYHASMFCLVLDAGRMKTCPEVTSVQVPPTNISPNDQRPPRPATRQSPFYPVKA